METAPTVGPTNALTLAVATVGTMAFVARLTSNVCIAALSRHTKSNVVPLGMVVPAAAVAVSVSRPCSEHENV